MHRFPVLHVHYVCYHRVPLCTCMRDMGFPGGSGKNLSSQVKNLPVMQETQVWSLCQEDPLEKRMATHSSILAQRITWAEEPGGLLSMGSQRVGHDQTCTHGESFWEELTPGQSSLLKRELLASCQGVWMCFQILKASVWTTYPHSVHRFQEIYSIIHVHKKTFFFNVSIQFSHSVVSDSLWSHGPQHIRPPCPSPTSRAYSNSCPLSPWRHP